jgi:6-phosphogluconolactonase (cycloisomerase 2 family)
LIASLDKPVGMCFDNNNEFLYVVDPTFGDQGYIYQFSIDWDDDDNFMLKNTEYTMVYQGANPYSSSVDEYLQSFRSNCQLS